MKNFWKYFKAYIQCKNKHQFIPTPWCFIVHKYALYIYNCTMHDAGYKLHI